MTRNEFRAPLANGFSLSARAVLLVCAAVLGCSGASDSLPPTTPPPVSGPERPALRNAFSVQTATVGSPYAFDASSGGMVFTDPAGAGLTYSVALSPQSNGLTVNAGQISGIPAAPMPMYVTVSATDARGGRASTTFVLIVFDKDLPEPVLPATPLIYDQLPEHFTRSLGVMSTDNLPAGTVLSNAVATLGRVLFYDRRMSANDRMSCSGCHIQKFGFADTARFSRGFQGTRTPRHSMTLANVRFYRRGRFFSDERAGTLEEQTLLPIADPTEMGMPLDVLVRKLEATSFYAPLFQAAFNSREITLDRISAALAAFLRSMVSGNSKFDQRFITGIDGLNEQELRGLEIFGGSGHCTVCHESNIQVLNIPRNTGLDETVVDAGIDAGRFKTPSLRNIAVTAPYMHDGRFKTLTEVVDFYDSGVRANPQLDNAMKDDNRTPRRLGLSAADRAALVAFMETLTDQEFLTDERFSNPFRK